MHFVRIPASVQGRCGTMASFGQPSAAAARPRICREADTADAPAQENLRGDFIAQLSDVDFMEPDHPLFFHGRGYGGPQKPPKVLWHSATPPRDDHQCPSWLTATEFEDVDDVARAKCRQLAALLRISRKTVCYTGAGISASAVGQAAKSGTNVQGWTGAGKAAEPTFTHHALGLLGREGLIQSWVQQNHDGLPQKAGYPQERINEIHGSWYDPGNPVVKYCGTLHERAYPWMVEDAATADLVLVLGTSLGGMNADQVATRAAERSLEGTSLGTVVFNLQQTPQDGKMTLRLTGKSDDMLRHLLRELGFRPSLMRPVAFRKENRALVPYDRSGRRLPEGAEKLMWLDFSERQKIRICSGHNIQGAMQPHLLHIDGPRATRFKGVERAPAPPIGCVLRRNESTASFVLQIAGETMSLGIWWLDVAIRGGVDQLPVVNESPKFQDDVEDASGSATRRLSTTAKAKAQAKTKAKAKAAAHSDRGP